MGIVENIKRLCVKNGTTIPKLEKEMGFGNGTIYNWAKSSPSIDKLQKVADHLKVSVDIVLYGFELTRFEEFFRIIMNKRTCDQFAKDTGIDIEIIEDYSYGVSIEQPSLDLVKKLASENPFKFIVDDESIYEAAGYNFEEISIDLLEDIPLELLHHYQAKGMSSTEMAIEYAKFRSAEYKDAMSDPLIAEQKTIYEPETIAAHHDGEDWSEEELAEIEQFKQFVKMKRQKGGQ